MTNKKGPLAKSRATTEELKLICAGIENQSECDQLQLGMKSLGPEGVRQVCASALKNTQITTLDLGHNSAGVEGAIEVAKLLKVRAAGVLSVFAGLRT
jgi:hypothetical protein